jgi:hypothetical protein
MGDLTSTAVEGANDMGLEDREGATHYRAPR